MEVRASPAASHVVVRDLVLARAKHEITNVTLELVLVPACLCAQPTAPHQPLRSCVPAPLSTRSL